MRPTSAKPGFPVGNPIANLLVIIAGALVIGASVVLGLFAFLALSAVVFVVAAVIGIRIWWLKRRFLKTGRGDKPQSQQSKSGGVIEGEYRVVVKDSDKP